MREWYWLGIGTVAAITEESAKTSYEVCVSSYNENEFVKDIKTADTDTFYVVFSLGEVRWHGILG